MIIRGFSEETGYICSQCQLKCCATEYDLPLLPQESEILRRKFNFSSFFIKSLKNNNWLIRGDSCPFLTSQGLCHIHVTNYKPLSCRIYPLIFWKISSDEILVWINPCRGTGFKWITDPESKIRNKTLEILYDSIEDKFNDYWGEHIDKNNPFLHVSKKRIHQEIDFFMKIDNKDLLNEFTKLTHSNAVNTLLDTLAREGYDTYLQDEFDLLINAVNHWLSWSPVGLQLTFYNSKLIFLIASIWIKFWYSTLLKENHSPLMNDRIQNQLGSHLASAILPSFWTHVEYKSQFSLLSKFSRQVEKILSGELPQDFLTRF